MDARVQLVLNEMEAILSKAGTEYVKKEGTSTASNVDVRLSRRAKLWLQVEIERLDGDHGAKHKEMTHHPQASHGTPETKLMDALGRVLREDDAKHSDHPMKC